MMHASKRTSWNTEQPKNPMHSLLPLLVLVVVVVLVIGPFLCSLLNRYSAAEKPLKNDYDDEDEKNDHDIASRPFMILFDHEKLDVYQLELAFISWVTTLFEHLKDQKPGRVSEVCDHLDRASLSSLFNTAEGNGKRQRATRAKFFDDA